ncbi:class I SAM-dependent methyltransferase [Actinoplanes sp. G11-F43]|uniref:class I SAM-dependent methyltransferase n=1 Tax=Actinoplanes sp. G11-F43 TaxID=3424130 RepID=UPI003D34C731
MHYLFDNATAEAARQVWLLAAILDGHTRDVLRPLGPKPGWTCLDLGAGAGSVARFLAGRGARVDAVDTDPRHLAEHELITVRTADVTTTDLGTGRYDLIHARLLFMHLPNRDEVLARAAAALKPGGRLVITDWDCTRPQDMLLTAPAPVIDAFLAMQTAMIEAGEARGMEAGWARRLPDAVHGTGLRVTAVVHNRHWTGGEPGMQLHGCNSRQLETPLLAAGVTGRQLSVLRAAMEDPSVTGYSYPAHTAVGVRD